MIGQPATSGPAEWLARRERTAVLVGLGVTVALTWAWLLAGGGMKLDGGSPGAMEMPGMGGMGEPALWSGASLVVFAMWSAMMVAMMLPGAAPAILLYAAISRSRVSTATLSPTGVFAAGYVLVWTAFGGVATVAHVKLQQAALLSPALRSTSAVLAALFLIAAGVYQLTPLKDACLRHCRAPIQFFADFWRPGTGGALRLGMLHGSYCVGCCWALMGVLFVVGIMNTLWIAVLAIFILIEKVTLRGPWLSRAMGVALIGWALYLLRAGLPG